ncbi:MAG: hypothetical protein LUI12_03620 [Clostridiales bacterium]|nr:hypothetical protein [Clostridiales bacterium]
MTRTGRETVLHRRRDEGQVRIDSSTIGMESARSYSATTAKKMSSVTVTYTGNGLTEGMFGNAGEAEGDSGETLNLEDITAHFRNLSNTSRVSSGGEEQDAAATIRQQCMRFLMELLFHFRGVRIDDVYGDQTGMISGLSGNGTQSISKMTSQTYYREEEYTAYSTAGTVRTADGRELSFHLEFGMSRSFEEYYEETYVTSVRDYCDPLVINLDTNVAQVSDQKFFFDLDCDGVQDEISTLNPGSGFLALDLNGDGVINDGGELFGTKSGDGFADLSQYDSDNNGWIDEADPIWDKLLIWTQDENGQDKLYHLADLGVGAIGLANVSTQFALNSQKDNANNAMIRSTGIFLYENGTVSTIQHLDLAR